MKRMILTLFALISLLLALATVGLWLWSCFVGARYTDVQSLGSSPNLLFTSRFAVVSRGGISVRVSHLSQTALHAPFVSPVERAAREAQFASMQAQLARQKYVHPRWVRVSSGAVAAEKLWWPFSINHGQLASGATGTSIYVAWWFLLLIFSVLPMLQIALYQRRRRFAKLGYCLACGYNLTGNASGVCPECGAVAQTRAVG